MFSFEIIPYTLRFQFDAGTSRGILREKKTWFIKLIHTDFPNRIGYGECGPLDGLSPENLVEFESNLHLFSEFMLTQLQTVGISWQKCSAHWMENWTGKWLPSCIFGWETAWLDWSNGGQRLICDHLFHTGQWAVPINGLVWMNSKKTMFEQAIKKRNQGFTTIKLKVGALDWQQELELIRDIRSEMPANEVTLRLDANGAWQHKEAQKKLEELFPFDIHSIEQPIKPDQIGALIDICTNSPIPIALDEELINKPFDHQKYSLLELARPQFIVLKPTLLGGLGQTDNWIRMAEDLGIDWWITSMLESNIGLNAVCQLAAQYRPLLPQGLGTGGLYTNNIPSQLLVSEGTIATDLSQKWDLSPIN